MDHDKLEELIDEATSDVSQIVSVYIKRGHFAETVIELLDGCPPEMKVSELSEMLKKLEL